MVGNYLTLIVSFHSINLEAISVKPLASAVPAPLASSKHAPHVGNTLASDSLNTKPRTTTIPKKPTMQNVLYAVRPVVKSSVTAAELATSTAAPALAGRVSSPDTSLYSDNVSSKPMKDGVAVYVCERYTSTL